MAHLSLLHISDLHLGPRPAGGRAPVDGYCTHDFLRIEALMFKVSDLSQRAAQKGGALACIVTGDLVTWGNPSSFAVAHTYLHERFQTTKQTYVGLQCLAPLDWIETVPGNHDYWPGRRMVGGVPPNDHFEMDPWSHRWDVGRIQLNLFGIDTNAGVAAFGAPRVLAQGNITQAHMNDLDRRLSGLVRPRGSKSFTIVAMHHSLELRGNRYIPGLFRSCIMEPRRRDDLLQLLHDREVDAILTGHTHGAGHFPLTAPKHVALNPIREFRCGTTTQTSGWINGQGNAQPNTLLLHEFDDDGMNATYRCTLHELVGPAFSKAAPVLQLNL
jgi:hypothetical protein